MHRAKDTPWRGMGLAGGEGSALRWAEKVEDSNLSLGTAGVDARRGL